MTRPISFGQTHRLAIDAIRQATGCDGVFGTDTSLQLLLSLIIVIVIIVLLLSQEALGVGTAL